MKLKYNLKFRLESRKDKNSGKLITENVPIYLDFTFEGKRLQYFTGFRIDSANWDPKTQRVKKIGNNKERIDVTNINNHLSDIEKQIGDIYHECKILHKDLHVDDIREELKKRLFEPEKVEKSFFEYMQEFIEKESKLNDWTKGTVTKFNTNYNQLLQFQEKYKFKIEFNRIDENFFNRYLTFQRDILEHRNTTMAKNLKILKWFLNWATRNGHNKNLFYKDFKPEFKGISRNHKIIFLTWDELMDLYKLEISQTYLGHVRDVFCFCCFTGLRYSDVYNLKRSNIKANTIEFTTVKTDEILIIDLNSYSREILGKYKDFNYKNDKCLPVISNQKFNDYLKKLGKDAGLDSPENVVYYRGAERIEKTYKKYELLSTHVGRKTFITNALFFNIPSEVIMSWTGHKDHKVMENYYKIIGLQKRREMDKFNEPIEKKDQNQNIETSNDKTNIKPTKKLKS
jgi:integrase